MNVVTEQLPVVLTAQQYANLAQNQLAAIPQIEKPITSVAFKIGDADAVVLSSTWNFKLPNGAPLRVAYAQYAVTREKTGYIITCATTFDQRQKYAGLFSQTASAFRVSK